jgi:2-polyprenyl-6-hydroxyphenyl methylase/3-demethylubiquinone-9 3-methyltransferase
MRYFNYWTKPTQVRGMSHYHDLVDWIGGYPFEVSKPEAIFEYFTSMGYGLIKLKTCGGGLGCNEFVFRKNIKSTSPAAGSQTAVLLQDHVR